MKDLSSLLVEKFKNKDFEKKYHRTSSFFRLADEVLMLRKRRGLTQKELAEKVGTTQAVISRLENATVKPSLETIIRIAEALEAAVDVRLLPLEEVRTNSEVTEEKHSVALKGIVYFGVDQLQKGTDKENLINSDQLASSISMMNMSTWPPIRVPGKKKKVPQIA